MALILTRKNQQGMSLVEIMVVIAIVSVSLIGMLNLAVMSLNAVSQARQADQAVFLAHESLEAARSFRDNVPWDQGLGILVPDADYHPVLQGAATTTWSFASGADTQGAFTRRVVVQNVSRDPVSMDIQPTYVLANDDPDTRRVISRISWGGKEMELVYYLTNWR